jgi:K+-transporting ATPase KdpF subunit
VSGDNLAGLIIAAGLLVFCLAALLFPEKF